MRLSVIILSKSLENLRPCVAAVQENEPSAEVIVVDDGLGLRPDLPNVRYIDGAKPFVYARNVNLGITEAFRHSVIDSVVLLNDDALLKSPLGFTLLAKTCEQNPGYGLIGATTNVTGNRNQWRRDVGFRDEPRMLTFVCVYIPRKTLELCGLLDERFTGYGCEDDDYSFTVRKAGLNLGVHDGCFVDHGSLKSSFRSGPKAGGDYRPNLRLFVSKWGHDNHGRPA